MSLRVWLPLTKDLRNQGLSTVSLSGSPTWGTGKIGEKSFCCNTGITGVTIDDLINVTEFSVAYWLYIDSSISDFTNYADCWELQATSGSTTTVIRDELRANTANLGCHALHMIKDASVGSNTNTYYGLGEREDAKDRWCHVVLVKNATYCDVYADGIKYAHVACSNFENSAAKLTGKFWLGMGGCKSAYLNDFRIYDHCLSQMEIKELAKGLVLHYPLNRQGWGQENQLKNSNFSNGTNSWYGVNSSSIRVETKDGYTCGTGTKGTSSNIIGQTSAAYTGGTTIDITVSARIYVTEAGILSVGHWITTTQASGWQGVSGSRVWNTTNSLSVGWNYISTTLKNATNQYTGNIVTAFGYTGTTFWITNVKLELGEIATPWCPNSSDALATTMGLNSTTEYDCSGFCNNGTRTGTFTWTSDTPKYAVSQYFNGSSYILTDSGTFSWFNFDKCTIAAWMKPTTTPSTYTGSIGISHDSGSSNKAFCISNYGGKFTVNNTNGSYVNTQSNYTLPLNEWHHCVATLDGTTVNMYVDGVLNKTFTIDWGSTTVLSSTLAQVGVDMPGTNEIYTGYYSDVRIYATALSANDVKSLYQNSACIDSSGNVYGAVHTEV